MLQRQIFKMWEWMKAVCDDQMCVCGTPQPASRLCSWNVHEDQVRASPQSNCDETGFACLFFPYFQDFSAFASP